MLLVVERLTDSACTAGPVRFPRTHAGLVLARSAALTSQQLNTVAK